MKNHRSYILLKAADGFVNVLTPLLAGLLVYAYPPTHFLRNYLPDGLWAYAFLSSILIIWNRQPQPGWIVVAVLAAGLFEWAQHEHLLAGTGDWRDMVIYLIFFGLALLTNSYMRDIQLKHTSNLKP